jgi:hypothetical protein
VGDAADDARTDRKAGRSGDGYGAVRLANGDHADGNLHV